MLFVYDGKTYSPFQTDIDALLKKLYIRSIEILSDGTLAIGSLKSGMFYLDTAGRLVRILNEENGLRYNNIFLTLEDLQGGIWATHFKGISRIQISSPISFLNQVQDVGNVFDMLVHENSLYVAGAAGVRYQPGIDLEPSKLYNRQFLEVSGATYAYYDLVSTANGVLGASRRGVALIEGGQTRQIATTWSRALELFQSTTFPNRVYVGLIGGFAYD